MMLYEFQTYDVILTQTYYVIIHTYDVILQTYDVILHAYGVIFQAVDIIFQTYMALLSLPILSLTLSYSYNDVTYLEMAKLK